MHIDKRNLGRGLVQIIKQKAFNDNEKENGKDGCGGYKHIRNMSTRKAVVALRQSRRCEEFAYRLELMMRGRGKEIHAQLNKDALYKIVKETKED